MKRPTGPWYPGANTRNKTRQQTPTGEWTFEGRDARVHTHTHSQRSSKAHPGDTNPTQTRT